MRLGHALRAVATVVGFGVMGLVVLGVVLLLAASPEPRVPRGATLVLRPAGDLPQAPPDDLAALVGRADGASVPELVASLDSAARDDRIAGVLLRPAALTTPYWAGIQEVRDAVLRFRESGKPITAFLEYGGEREYYLATAADRVVLLPTSPLDLTGVASYEIFLGGLLDRLGAEPDFIRVGDYKTAPNQFTERGFTPAHLEATEAFTGDVYAQLVTAVAGARGLSEAEVRALVDRGPLTADEALAAGLVDELAYADQLDGAGGASVSGAVYRRVSPRAAGFRPGPRVALLSVSGVIASGEGGYDPLNGTVAGSDALVEEIRRISDDASFAAVVVRVDSPGGSSVASDVVWRALRVARDRRPDRPVIASMGDVAASGGYYVAMAADTIVAQPATLTGSIGVYAGKVAVGGLLERWDVGTGVVEAGRNAGVNSPFEPFTPDQRARLEASVGAFYETFVARAAEARGVTPEAIDAVAQGRVWSGASALEQGLVDRLGGLDVALALAREAAGIAADADVEVVRFPRPRSLYEIVTRRLDGGAGGLDLRGFLAGREARALAALAGPLRLFRAGEPLALLPFALVQ